MLKGALIRYASHLPEPRVVPFQFNPEQITRTQSGGRDTAEPAESIRFDLLLHAGGLEEGADDFDEDQGIYPLIASLEELLSRQAHSLPTSLPFNIGGNRPYSFVSFRWGARELPVELQRLDIRERLFNAELAPVHANVVVHLRVLTHAELTRVPSARTLLTQYRKLRRVQALS
jgi:hypothetical protein